MFSIISAAVLLCCACSAPEDVPAAEGSLSVSPSELVLGYEEGEAVIEVNSDCEWGASVGDATWCTIFPGGGIAGETSVKVKVSKNMSAEERTGIVTFRYGNSRKELKITQTPSSDGPQMFVPEGYKLIWSDEFDGKTLNADNWTAETGAGGWGNAELQYYTDRTENVDVRDGKLVITARRENYKGAPVTSARLITLDKVKFLYGYVVASIKLPKTANGLWPAFWMMPKNFKTWPGDGEIDIMEEVGYNPNRVSSSIHCNAYNHGIGTQKTNEILIATAQTEFHTYAVEWTEDYLKFYFDGQLHFTFTNDKKGDYNTWPFFNPFYLKLNLAWGGNWGGAQGIDESCLPAVYEVDYVRVFKKIE